MLKGKFNQKCLQYGHGHRAWTLIYIVRTYRFHCLGWKRGPCVVLFQRLAYQMLSSAIRNNLILRSFFKFIVDRCSVLCVRFAHCPLPIVKFRKKEITRENKWKTRLWIGIIKIKLTYRFVSELFVWLRWSDDYSSFFVFFFLYYILNIYSIVIGTANVNKTFLMNHSHLIRRTDETAIGNREWMIETKTKKLTTNHSNLCEHANCVF